MVGLGVHDRHGRRRGAPDPAAAAYRGLGQAAAHHRQHRPGDRARQRVPCPLQRARPDQLAPADAGRGRYRVHQHGRRPSPRPQRAGHAAAGLPGAEPGAEAGSDRQHRCGGGHARCNAPAVGHSTAGRPGDSTRAADLGAGSAIAAGRRRRAGCDDGTGGAAGSGGAGEWRAAGDGGGWQHAVGPCRAGAGRHTGSDRTGPRPDRVRRDREHPTRPRHGGDPGFGSLPHGGAELAPDPAFAGRHPRPGVPGAGGYGDSGHAQLFGSGPRGGARLRPDGARGRAVPPGNDRAAAHHRAAGDAVHPATGQRRWQRDRTEHADPVRPARRALPGGCAGGGLRGPSRAGRAPCPAASRRNARRGRECAGELAGWLRRCVPGADRRRRTIPVRVCCHSARPGRAAWRMPAVGP